MKGFTALNLNKLLQQYSLLVRDSWGLGDFVEKPRAWRLPMSCIKRHGPGWVAVGDAAGFVNPMNGEGIDYGLESGVLAVEKFLQNPETASLAYDAEVGDRFDAFLRTGRRFSFLIGHPWLLKPGLRIAVGTQKAADITLAVMGNLIDSSTSGSAGRIMRVADTSLRIVDPLLRLSRARA
jgi:menaquinone-9 beta-reductase